MAGGSLSTPTATLTESLKGKQNYTAAFGIVTSLFFMWAVAVNMNDVLIPHLKKACDLTDFESSLIQTAFFGAYFLMALPAGWIMKRVGYGKGIIIGLAISALGVLLFYPAAETRVYGFFLAALFIMACGSATLEVAANPYVSVLGDPAKSEFRLNLAQTFNAVGAFITPLIGKHFILSGIEHTPAELAAMTADQIAAYRDTEASQVKMPYLVLFGTYLAIMLLVYLAKLPELKEEKELEDAGAEVGIRSVWKIRHTRFGIIAQFFYVGAQVCLASFMIRYAQAMLPGMGERIAADYLFYHLVGFAIGRLVGTFLMRYIAAPKLLSIFAVVAALLIGLSMVVGGPLATWAAVLTGFFNSIMFSNIFTLGIAGVGKYTEQASGILVMAIVGGAIMPLSQGLLADQIGLQSSFIVPIFCYAYLIYFGWKGHKTV
jgi:FHS family L-fucose permease-like MFS transporter